jgi:hypothetical protein
MPLGLGIAPFGTSIFGYGSPDPAPIQQRGLLVNLDGTQGDGRRVDPATGQYVLDVNGRTVGMTGVQQLVLMRAKTVLNSSAVHGLGLEAPGGNYDQNAPLRLEKQLRLAFKDLTDAGVIQIIDVTIKRNASGVVFREMHWRDLTATTSASLSSTEQTVF